MHIGIPLDYRWWQDWRVDKYVGASHDLPVVLSRLECNDWGNTLIFDTFTQGYTPQRNCCPHQARQWLCSETLTLTWSSGSNTPQRNRCLHQTRPWLWRDVLMLTRPLGATLRRETVAYTRLDNELKRDLDVDTSSRSNTPWWYQFDWWMYSLFM